MTSRKQRKYNPTNGHFVHRKPDENRDDNIRAGIPPEHKFYLHPYCWDEPTPSLAFNYIESLPVYRSMPTNFRIFLDTGFLTSHEIPAEFLQTLTEKQLFLTRGVVQELDLWLSKRIQHNSSFREIVCDEILAENEHRNHDLVSIASLTDFSSEMREVAIYYTNLLALRKQFGIQRFQKLTNRLQRDPTTKEIQPEIETIAGSRGWRIAQKAIDERGKAELYTDELLVVTAVFHAILYGQPTVIFTRDTDVFEQFYKLLYLIDTHHMSMCVADTFLATKDFFSSSPFPLFVDSPLYHPAGAIYLSPSDSLQTLRSTNFDVIQCTCVLMSTSDRPLMFSQRSFGITRDFERLLEVKSRTKGKNTELLGEFNAHVLLDPRKVLFGESGPAVVRDKFLEGMSNYELQISLNDAELAIFGSEGFATTKVYLDK